MTHLYKLGFRIPKEETGINVARQCVEAVFKYPGGKQEQGGAVRDGANREVCGRLP